MSRERRDTKETPESICLFFTICFRFAEACSRRESGTELTESGLAFGSVEFQSQLINYGKSEHTCSLAQRKCKEPFFPAAYSQDESHGSWFSVPSAERCVPWPLPLLLLPNASSCPASE